MIEELKRANQKAERVAAEARAAGIKWPSLKEIEASVEFTIAWRKHQSETNNRQT